MTTPVPTTPTLTLATDQQTYTVGQAITVTATYTDSSVTATQLTIDGSFTDPSSGSQVTAQTVVTVQTQQQQAAQNPAVTDSFGDVYTITSNELGTFVATSTIGNPPA
jgi:hypothetical protein